MCLTARPEHKKPESPAGSVLLQSASVALEEYYHTTVSSYTHKTGMTIAGVFLGERLKDVVPSTVD